MCRSPAVKCDWKITGTMSSVNSVGSSLEGRSKGLLDLWALNEQMHEARELALTLKDSGTSTMSLNASMDNVTMVPLFLGLNLLFELKPLFIPLYVVLVVVACAGNLILVAHISTTKKLHTTTNFLIGNLAASDLVMCIFCVPMTVSYAFETKGWLFGIFMCYFITLMQSTTVFVSVLSLTAIAVDRYVVVAYPIHQRIRPRYCAYIVAFIWLVSAGVSMPSCLHTSYIDLNQIGYNMIICEEAWIDLDSQRLLYSCVMLLLSYMLPLCAVSISYCAISHHLKKRSVPGAASCSQDKWSKKRRRTFWMLAISVLSFALCWFPLQAINLIRDIDLDILDKSYINVIQIACHLVAMSSACYNPFIYASLHNKFRVQLSNLLFCNKKQANTSTFSQTSRMRYTITSLDTPATNNLKDKLCLR
ncbi:prolactin releasing hormone 2 receptor [Stegostoma tigrinum]|uniref:prolactin releasing hormone 2 receptor n=1 Tax=Stegostoma tigrinum TaxID=3053191 RepID=UPI00286FF7EF|nr:prolactin releasing hormone 2 receptor [Stegostoma tigrinum]